MRIISSSENIIVVGRLKQVFKPRLTKLIEVHGFCEIIYRIVQIIFCLLAVQFLVHFLVQFHAQLLENQV